MSKSGITNIKESIEKLINEQRANKPKDIGVPKDKDLPFFAYGFLKSDELAYHKIKDLVRNNHPNKIVEGFLYEKDGIPIFTQERKVKRIPYDSIQGELIYFTDGNEAYKKIAEIEPGDLYCWGTIKIDSYRIANVLIASEELLSEKKTINGAVKLEKADNLYVDWHGYRDVLFTKGMQFLQDEFFNNLDYDKPHGKRFRSDKEYQDFFKLQMAYGYYLCSKKLFDDVNSLLTKYDVPAGLTVPVVDNILERKTCICGNCWTKEMLAHIDKLKKTLPPDNINSTLGEMVRQKILQCGNIRSILIKESGNLAKTDKNISQIREDIASLSARISNSGSPDAKSIEKDNIEVQKNIGIYENKINELEDTIPELEKLLENERKERDNFQDHSGEIERINTKIALIDKCLKAIEQIKIMNQQTALKSINSILKEAYELLSDDADMGRRLYVIEHSEKHRMVSYLDKKLKQKLKSFKESGTYSKLVDAGLSEEQILEQAILKCELPNSTGQSKMNTLAFVKAILDYSNQKRPNDSIQITKQYPLLIDAPFGDIFDKNLEKSALALNDFTHQIILMIARDSYQSVEHFIKSGIKTVHILEKVKDEDRSIIKPCRLGAL